MPTADVAILPKDTLADELRHIPILEDLSEEAIRWLVEHMTVQAFEPGEILSDEGNVADKMSIILEGEIKGVHEKQGGDGRIFQARAGMVIGTLPYSRLSVIPLTVRAVVRSRIAWLHKDDFPELIATLPTLVQRLVGIMADRIRDYTTEQQQKDKLMSLGRLSAGLAHELNNPAAAAQRSTEALRDAMRDMRQANLRLQSRELTDEQRRSIAQLEADWDERTCANVDVLSPLERCDREDTFTAWLESHGVEEAWSLAPSLVESSCDLQLLDQMARLFSGPALGDALARLAASFTASRLIREIENATKRISELVRAVKEYSYMDQAPVQEVDVHRTIESTITMMQHRLRGITVDRKFDPELPPICAHGSELNQVWTNLIDNASDAMEGSGTLTIRTSREYGQLRVEFQDTGHGIPENIMSRIFDPFFTTKKVGAGTGLGLDTVYRIVKKHQGDIKVESRPGNTVFRVWLPFAGQISLA